MQGQRQDFNDAIAEKVAALRNPEAYPTPVDEIEVRETHMSWVFLTQTWVYKLKKPVRYDYLDFSTIEARHRNCTDEVRLNRRLADGVYEGVVPLVVERDGRLKLEGRGVAIEWLVKMHRLPKARMLDTMLGAGALDQEALARAMDRLAQFYNRAPRAPFGPIAYIERLLVDINANRDALATADSGLNGESSSIADRQCERVGAHKNALMDRVRQGHILEAHGDLRPEHVCLGDPPVFIDCLEFNRDFRMLDTVDELSFLALECGRLSAHRFPEEILFDTYSERTGDRPDPALVALYKSHRASLRAKLAVWHIADSPESERDKWLDRAREYLALAAHYIDQA